MKNRNRENDLLTRRLIAAGCRVTMGEESNVEPDITIEPRDAKDNKVFDLHSRGGIGDIFHVKITNRAYRSLFISDFKCRLLWDDPHFTWLLDIRKYRSESEEYRHPGGRVFRRDEVLLYEGLLGKDGSVGSGPALHFCRPPQSGHGRRDAHEFHLEQTRRGRFARTLGHRSSCGTMDRITVEDRGSNPDRMRFRPSFS